MSFKIAIFSLNQWALDFEENTSRIISSIEQAYEAGAIYRAGPELEVCGYSLEDAFHETDTIEHCWSCLEKILKASESMDMIVDVGMPVRFSALYNCRVICYKGGVICIRAKTSLAREGCYREYRHFQPWPNNAGTCSFNLPILNRNLDQICVPMGSGFVLELNDRSSKFNKSLRIGWDICQELWDVKNTSSYLYSDFGCHLILNGSASYWELRKLETINDMIRGISLRSGACYAFSNLVGCDGQRYVFSGRSCIYDNGLLVGMTSRSAELFKEVEMITHTVRPSKIDENRAIKGVRLDMSSLIGEPSSHGIQDSCNPNIISLAVDTSRGIVKKVIPQTRADTDIIDANPKIPFELEIRYYVSLWLWDYLRRSGMKGFMMPLSGGLDSSTVAVLVYSMCCLLYEMKNEISVRRYFSRQLKIAPSDVDEELDSPEKICSILLKCRYISTQHSGQYTLRRARDLSLAIGANFEVISIQDLYERCRCMIGKTAEDSVDLLDQNIQARLRMAMTYYMSEGDRIVLATGNVDEALMGYLTKYDCSSADINPIGGLCKSDLKSYLKFCLSDLFKNRPDLIRIVREIIDAPPSAELTGCEQRDEDEIGVTYDEISILGRVRHGAYGCSGPRGAFETVWSRRHSEPFCSQLRCLRPSAEQSGKTDHQVAIELANLIKRFYQRYTRNRHKLTVLTPALHAETYSPDDNRFDHRQFLYPPLTLQFEAIDELVDQIGRRSFPVPNTSSSNNK